MLSAKEAITLTQQANSLDCESAIMILKYIEDKIKEQSQKGNTNTQYLFHLDINGATRRDIKTKLIDAGYDVTAIDSFGTNNKGFVICWREA